MYNLVQLKKRSIFKESTQHVSILVSVPRHVLQHIVGTTQDQYHIGNFLKSFKTLLKALQHRPNGEGVGTLLMGVCRCVFGATGWSFGGHFLADLFEIILGSCWYYFWSIYIYIDSIYYYMCVFSPVEFPTSNSELGKFWASNLTNSLNILNRFVGSHWGFFGPYLVAWDPVSDELMISSKL